MSAPVLAAASLTLNDGQSVGIFGDSGSGKTTLVRAILRLLPAKASCTGVVRFRSRDLFLLSGKELRQVRGSAISVIGQEPAAALCPVRRIDGQIADVLRAHLPLSREQCVARARQSLDLLFTREESRRIGRSFPSELSGGERQRALIAQAVCCHPSLLIADEPTASLDSVTQLEILRLLVECRREFGMALMVISHDLAVLSYLSDRVVRLRDGRLEH